MGSTILGSSSVSIRNPVNPSGSLANMFYPYRSKSVPMGLSRSFHWDFYETPMGLPRVFHGTPMGLPSDYCIPWIFHATSMRLFPMVLPWDSRGTSVRLPWCFHGTPMRFNGIIRNVSIVLQGVPIVSPSDFHFLP